MTNLVVIEPPDNLPIEEEEQRMASSTGCGGSSVNSCLPELAHIMFTTALGNDDGDDDAYKDVGDAALDSILETTVAEVTAALSHTDDAEEVANATTAALDAACAAAAQLCEPTLPPNDYELDTTTLLLPPPPVATIAPSVPAVASNRNKRSLEEQQLNLIQNVNRNVAAAGAAVATKAPPSGRRNSDIPVAIVKNYQVGRWSQDERILFLYGLQTFGKGRWKKISSFVPNRSLVQIKSHAQKVLKRMDAGEDVFRKLEEHVSRLHFLVSEVHESLGLDPPTVVLRPSGAVIDVLRQHQQQQDRTISVKRQRHNDNTVTKKAPDGTAQILAASALCQLAGPEGEGSSSNSSISGGGGGATEECSSKEDSTSAASAKLDDMIVVAMANSVNNPILDDNEEATKTQIDEDIVVDVTLI